MDALQAIILGLVEGITEYLPVSSTGHLIIASSLLFGDALQDQQTKRAIDDFNIVIQGGAILAVLGLYRARVIQMIRGVLGHDPAGRRLAINILIAFIPAAALGVLLEPHIDHYLFHPVPVLIALVLGGIWMIWLDLRRKRHARDIDPDPDDPQAALPDDITIEHLTWRGALLIGLFQCVAMWPGTSRSMMTIAGGTMIGLRPKDAAEFSFLLGLPTLAGACVYKLAKNLKHASDTGTPNMFQQLGIAPVLIGLVVATISAALAVRWLVAFLNHHGLAPFGYYRLALTAVLAALLLTGAITFA